MIRFLVLVVSLFACQSSVEDILSRMQSRACAADVSGFFKNVNKDKLQINYFKHAIAKGIEKDDKLKLYQMYKEYLNVVSDDLQRGQEGAFCRHSVLQKRISKNEAVFIVALPDKSRRRLHFLRFAKNWLLAAYLPLPEKN
ncbi:MAG: hypothetical protein AAF518_05100 [Spirochaetota bacterium]